MIRPKVLALVLAGGKGSRMGVLTEDRAKPSLPFGGAHRLIDFPLTNCRLSGIVDVWVIQQHNPHSLISHLANGRPWDLDRTLGGFRILHPFTAEDEDEGWHQGNADALFVHRDFIRACSPTHVLVLSADHVYSLDFGDVLDAHERSGAGLTLVTSQLDGDVSRYGVVETEGDHVVRFQSKPEQPASNTVATEVFLYDASLLLDTLEDVAGERGEDDLGDFGEHLVPRLVDKGSVGAFQLPGYWRDVGTVESYWEGHMDLLGSKPALDLHDPEWPILGQIAYRPAARVLDGAGIGDSVMASGSIVAGTVLRSVVGLGARVDASATVSESVLLDDVGVAEGATVHRAVVAEGVRIGRGAVVGDPSDGAELTVVGAGVQVEPGAHVQGEVLGEAA